MDEKNPINACLPSQVRNRVILNRSGRPSMKNMVKFGPQPKSMVVQMLNKVKTNEFDTNLSIVDINLAFKVNKDLINSNRDHNSPNSLPLTSPLRNYIKKRRLSEATDNSIEPNSQIKATVIDKNINEVIENKAIAIHVDGNHEEEISSEFAISENTKTQKSNITKEDNVCVKKDKQFLCDFPNCDYSCKLSSNLIKHKRVHTNDKPYLCEKCCFRSNFINSLKVHERIHTAERPYQCVHCSYRCNSSSNLKKHCMHRHSDCYVNTDKQMV